MNIREWWRKCQLLLIIASGTYPLVMVLLDRLNTQILMWGWVFPLAYVVLALVGISVKGQLRMAAGIAMSVGYIAATFLLVPGVSRLGALAAAVLCCGLLLWSLKIGGWSSKKEIPVLWIAMGAICHGLGQAMLHVDRVAGGQGLAIYNGMFLAALFVFVLLTMLSMNRDSLTSASGKRQSVPGTMRQKNVLLIFMFFILAVAASALPSAFSGIMGVLERGIAWLVDLVIRLIPDTTTQKVENIPAPTGDISFNPGGGDGGEIILNPVAEKIMAFIGGIIFFSLLLYVLYRLYRMAGDTLRRFVASLGKFAANVSEDYIDEVTDTREDGTAEKLERKPLAARLPIFEPRNLSPGERIRFRYQRMMRAHPEWLPGSTARENLPREMASLYERARYSAHPVSDGDAAAFAEGSKKI